MKLVTICQRQWDQLLAALNTPSASVTPIVLEAICAEVDGEVIQITPTSVYDSTSGLFSAGPYLDQTGTPVVGVVTVLDPCDDRCCGCPDCLTGDGPSPLGRLKYDVNPGSFSQATMDNSSIEISFADCDQAPISVPITGTLDVQVDAGTGDPHVVNFVDAFNSIGGNFTAVTDGLDGEQTNSIMCITVPDGVGDITVTILTQGGGNWTLTYIDATNSFSVLDDNATTFTGSEANK